MRKPIQKNTYVEFFMGGGATILALGLIGAAVVNGNWDEANTFTNYNYGDQWTVHNIACSIIGLALFSCIFAILAVWFGLTNPEGRCVQYVLWGASLAVFIGTIVTEILCLSYTQYGENRPNRYYLDEDEDLRKYIELYYQVTEKQGKEYKETVLKPLADFWYMKKCNMTAYGPKENWDAAFQGVSPEAYFGWCMTKSHDAMDNLNEKCNEEEVFGENCVVGSESFRGDPIPQVVDRLVVLMSAIGMLPVSSSAPGAGDKVISPLNKKAYSFTLDEDGYMMYFEGRKMEGKTVPHVILNWTGMIMDGTIMTHDPCNYMFDNSYQIAAIGHWDAEKFRKYWCKEYRRQVHDMAMRDEDGELSDLDDMKRTAMEHRAKQTVSIYALYEMNAIMLGIQVTGFVVIIVALFFDVGTQDRLLPEAEQKKEDPKKK